MPKPIQVKEIPEDLWIWDKEAQRFLEEPDSSIEDRGKQNIGFDEKPIINQHHKGL